MPSVDVLESDSNVSNFCMEFNSVAQSVAMGKSIAPNMAQSVSPLNDI